MGQTPAPCIDAALRLSPGQKEFQELAAQHRHPRPAAGRVTRGPILPGRQVLLTPRRPTGLLILPAVSSSPGMRLASHSCVHVDPIYACHRRCSRLRPPLPPAIATSAASRRRSPARRLGRLTAVCHPHRRLRPEAPALLRRAGPPDAGRASLHHQRADARKLVGPIRIPRAGPELRRGAVPDGNGHAAADALRLHPAGLGVGCRYFTAGRRCRCAAWRRSFPASVFCSPASSPSGWAAPAWRWSSPR